MMCREEDPSHSLRALARTTKPTEGLSQHFCFSGLVPSDYRKSAAYPFVFFVASYSAAKGEKGARDV